MARMLYSVPIVKSHVFVVRANSPEEATKYVNDHWDDIPWDRVRTEPSFVWDVRDAELIGSEDEHIINVDFDAIPKEDHS